MAMTIFDDGFPSAISMLHRSTALSNRSPAPCVSACPGAKPKSHLVYLYCAYTLVAMGKGADQAKVMAFAKALGVTPDQEAAREALEVFEDKYKPK